MTLLIYDAPPLLLQALVDLLTDHERRRYRRQLPLTRRSDP
jgi:hypothetical protein